MIERILVRKFVTKGTDAREVQSEIAEIWKDIRSDQTVREDAAANELDPTVFDDAKGPFSAERPDNQFGVSGGLLLWLAGVVAGRVVGKGVDWLLDNVIIPRLKQRFGAKLQETQTDT
jgi:hypothetical protein